MNDFFQTLHSAMRDKENLRIELTRDGDRMKVMVQPLLGAEPDDADHDEPNDAAQVRAALALPLSLHMDPRSLDEQFGQNVRLYGEARAPLHDSFNILLDNLKEAGKTAKVAVGKSKVSPASPPKPSGKTKPEVAVDDDAGGDGGDKDAGTCASKPVVNAAAPVQQTIL